MVQSDLASRAGLRYELQITSVPIRIFSVAAASPLTISIGKQAYYAQIELDQPRAYAYAKEVMSMNAAAYDAQEGITAFLEKRPACWKGK